MLDTPLTTFMGNCYSPGCRWWYLWLCLFVLSFFPRDVLDEIWDWIRLVSEGFPTYSRFAKIEQYGGLPAYHPVPGRPTIWITVGQGPTVLAVGAGGGGLDIFTLIYPFSPLSPSLWETARYRLKYCLKGPLNPNQPTNQHPAYHTYNM